MRDDAYEAYVDKCLSMGIVPSSKEKIQKNEELIEFVAREDSLMRDGEHKGYISSTKAKEFVIRAYDMGYKDALREIAS